MKIGILGAGVVGTNLAQGWAQKEHHIMLSSRHPQSSKMQNIINEIPGNVEAGTVLETINFSDMLVLAVAWDVVQEVLAHCDDWTGKIIIDTTNRVTSRTPRAGKISPNTPNRVSASIDHEETTAAATVAKWAQGAKVVKAYNIIGAEHMASPVFNNQRPSMFICGDAEARTRVRPLIIDSGFEVVEVGDLTKADLLESLAWLWISLAYEAGYGRDIAFRLLQK